LNYLLYSEFIFEKRRDKYQAFKNIGIGKSLFDQVSGLKDIKLMGAGAGSGFSIWPDFKRYALLFFFDSQEVADSFISENKTFNWYVQQSSQRL